MNLFFGKISQKFDTNQIEEGYYKAPKGSSWFGEINVGDYVYLIGGDRIQLWQAREWGNKDGQECLFFDILIKDLGIKVNKLIALRFLKLSKALVVLTVRSARNRAFFKLDLVEEISIDLLKDITYYTNPELYRNIRVIQQGDLKSESKDLQVYYENEALKFHPAEFIDASILSSFKNNLSNLGKGAKMKDTVLEKIKKALEKPPVVFTPEQLSIRSFYDAFFCDYKDTEKYYLVGSYWKGNTPEDMTEVFLKDSLWKNGYDDKNIEEVNSIADGSHIAIKASYTRNKTTSVIMIKARGVVKKNLQDGHTLEMEWEEDFKPFELPIGGYLDTVREVTNKDHIQRIWYSEAAVVTEEDRNGEHKYSLNQILYGPPGTGKTYFTIDRAVKIITGKSSDHAANKLVFDGLRKEGQIEFLTFHQNYSYEDFMVGIRPDAEMESLRFRPYKGIFYQLVDRAKQNYFASQKGKESLRSFEDVFAELISPLDKDEEVPIRMLSDKYFKITDVENGTIRFIKPNGSDTHTLSVDTLKAIVEDKRDFHSGLGSYYKPLVALLKQKQKLDGASKETVKNFVLIIDEINRANISRVFGELITLLEDDKRIDGDNELTITLPNGEKEFGIPPNLYVIGTMNTADKSIALIDVALRRRFEFEGFYPDSEKLKDEYSDRVKLLEQINEAVFEKKKSADYLVGHGYFMKKESTTDILCKKIVPLLMEYFSGRVGEVESVFEKTDYLVKYDSKKFIWNVAWK
jgi:hypothetical protein